VKRKPLSLAQLTEARLLQSDIIVVIQIVQAHDLLTLVKQFIADVVSDEPCRSGYQDAFHQTRLTFSAIRKLM
jgi:hypothetical protein